MKQYFFLLLLSIIIITLLVKKPFYKKAIIVENNQQMQLKHVYNDLNLYAPVHKFSETTLYETAPRVSINDTVSIKSYFEQTASSLKCKFEINTDGIMIYTVNDQLIWKSDEPRKINQCAALTALLNYADENEWKPVFSTKKYDFSIAPLAISKQCGKIIWTFYSGWDSSEFNKKTFGEVMLISDCRKYRVALLDNSDLVVLKTNTEDKKTFKMDLNVSLIETYKIGHN